MYYIYIFFKINPASLGTPTSFTVIVILAVIIDAIIVSTKVIRTHLERLFNEIITLKKIKSTWNRKSFALNEKTGYLLLAHQLPFTHVYSFNENIRYKFGNMLST